jgi:hypothetical protein
MARSGLLRIIVLLLGVAAPAAAVQKPTAQEVQSHTILGDSQIDAILAGEGMPRRVVPPAQ